VKDFHFTGQPSVSLSNVTADGRGVERVAWDAVAFQPLGGKPQHQIVAMGDSYASGEAATEGRGDHYYPETDYHNSRDESTKNACHRSTMAWSRQATLPGQSHSVGALADAKVPQLDYQFIACSGARHYNILTTGQYSELPQIEQGYLDQHTTLVPLSIGGNDMRFSDVVFRCFTRGGCQDSSIVARDPDTGEEIPGEETGPLKDWAEGWARDEIRPRLVATLHRIQQLAPNAQIVLMGYPRLVEENVLGCQVGLELSELRWLNGLADMLARHMGGAVLDARSQHGVNAVFVDPRPEFAGRGICGPAPVIEGVVLDRHSLADSYPVSMKAFHPNIAGARLYADALERVLGAL
jgi:hypothetical protein